jgi:hypothetical protein
MAQVIGCHHFKMQETKKEDNDLLVEKNKSTIQTYLGPHWGHAIEVWHF